MTNGTHTIEMIQRVVDALTLFPDEWLNKASVVFFADHRRDVALEFGHLAGCPGREIAECHFVALADDVVEFVKHDEVDIVDTLHLALHLFRMQHRVDKHLVGAFQGGQHVKSFH